MFKSKMFPLSIVLLGSFVMLFFNNCSDVNFAPTSSGEKLSSSASASQLPVDNNSGEVSSNGQDGMSESVGDIESTPEIGDEVLLEMLPEVEQDVFRPISDIDKFPELAEIYSCPLKEGILICHFPNNLDSAHTLCVGGKAPESHKSHEAAVSPDGQLLELSDYLGPCKHASE